MTTHVSTMTNQYDNGYGWFHCKCCPYGYHIDLDFVRYCESIGQPVERTGSIKRRKDRRRQRQSMEVLLGLSPSPVIVTKEPLPPPPLTPSSDHPLLHDDLNDAVKDFERTLQRSKNKLSNNLPDVTAVSGSGDGPKDFDSVSIESSTCGGLSPAALQTIREQMALSLERTRELEEAVKMLPGLQEQIAALEDENRRLEQKLRVEEENKLNRINSNYLFQFPYGLQRNRSASLSDTIDNCQKVPPPPPPRRDFGVTAGVLTRNVGVGNQTPHTKNVATATTQHQGEKGQHVDRWYAEKSRFLNGGDYIPPPAEYRTRNTKDASTQTNRVSDRRNVAVQTAIIAQQLRDLAVQANIKPQRTHCGVNAVTATAESSVQISPKLKTTAVSDDTINDILCAKCNVSKRSVGINTSLSESLAGSADNQLQASLSLAALSASPRSKSFNLGEDKLNLSRCRTVGCQYEYRSHASNKSSQTEVKTTSKHSQHEIVLAHKSMQSEHMGHSKCTDTSSLHPGSQAKSTDTKGLGPLMKHKACEAAVKRCETAEASCHADLSVKEAPSVVAYCAKCDKEAVAEDASKKDEPVTPSRIPRLQMPTTPVENRTYRRQDTYTKIPPTTFAEKSPTGLTALELSPKSITTEVSPIEKVKQKYKLSTSVETTVKSVKNGPSLQSSTSTSFTHQPLSLTSPTSSSLQENAMCQSQSPRKKCIPSREMQAAMKVLNDNLQKHSGKEARGSQMKNANAIIEQEWFKISSVVHADPLDVEDYLDAFEDVSASLLQFIVNMVDTSGNTAMHYAVSHGNFDVVSILLDSKVCDINRQNKAGYTSVMLVSLAEVRSDTHANVVRRLFSLADVNIRAKQHGQTALMLAVSHGRLDMVKMLIEAGADINIQDEDGSTALMCAAEHGHVEIVKHFLSQTDCDSSIKDIDGSMALQIAMDAGHRHIGVLLYAHNRNQHGADTPPPRPKKSKSTSASPKMPSSPLMQRSFNRALPTTGTNK